MAGFIDNYVPVEERVERFYEKHPDGSIQTEVAHLDSGLVVMKATAYRTADDERPTTGHSQMNIPGSTSFTKGSEVENAETSAVGRALALMGFEVKRGIASREEVANKGPLPPADQLPAWASEFNKERKERGITAEEIATVIGASGTISNIERWLKGDEKRTPATLLNLAADLKAVPA